MTETQDKGWCVLELMGHRKLAGYVSDDEGLTRIDVYLEDPERLVDDHVVRTGTEPIATQWYGRAAIYCITATTVDLAIALAKSHQPAPVGRWELPEETPVRSGAGLGQDRYEDADEVEVDEDGIPY